MAASRWLPRLIGPLVLVAILLSVDLTDIAAALGGVEWLPLAGACVAVLPTVALRSCRWRILVRASGDELGRLEALHIYAFSILVGTATPGRLGELVKIGHLRHRDVPMSAAVLSVGLDRVFDVAFLLVVGAGAVVAMAGSRFPYLAIAASIAAALGMVAAIWCIATDRGRATVGVIAALLAPARFAERVVPFLDSIAARAVGLSPRALLRATLLTALTWALTYLAVYLCAVSLRLAVPFVDICGVTAVSSLVTFVPISILGLGTREASLIALLAPYGVTAGDAIALSALYLGITVWVGLACAYSLLTPAAREWKRASP